MGSLTAIAEPPIAEAPVAEMPVRAKRRGKNRKKPKRQPRYHVILWNDDEHSYGYVMRMMSRLFGFTLEKGFQIAAEVDLRGRAICTTTTLEHAELKRDQIHGFGPDRTIERCRGAMWATIEPDSSE